MTNNPKSPGKSSYLAQLQEERRDRRIRLGLESPRPTTSSPPSISEQMKEAVNIELRTRPANFHEIKQAVCDYCNIGMNDLVSPCRLQKLFVARMIAVYLAKKITLLSFPAIGKHMGGRDHTSIMHCYNRAVESLETNDFVAEAIDTLLPVLSNVENVMKEYRKDK